MGRLKLHIKPMMSFDAWVLEHPSIYLGLALTFLGLYILYQTKTNTLSLATIATGIAISVSVPCRRTYMCLGGFAYPHQYLITFLIGIAFILIGIAGFVKTREKEP